ncbi:BLUF domain-containing protein [Nocardioides sp.]|uniref:BLUF domain-containing protein n=1 Tax=Nocardioides sp. TaxID=35761 RepID=UPI00286E815E|nr:BLUF domain-containing protein [Nocardioides sp.]
MTDAAVIPGAESTFRLMYRSRNLIPPDRVKKELGTLFGAARSNNKSQHITGALLLDGEHYVQVLEGDEVPVRALYEHITKDPRHDSVALIEAGPVDGRVFSRWSMAQVGEGDEADIPLIAHTDGISPAAGRRTTPEQEAVLDVMRAAAATASSA